MVALASRFHTFQNLESNTQEAGTYGDIGLSDGVLKYAKTLGENKGAFLAFQKHADQIYPGWEEKVGHTGSERQGCSSAVDRGPLYLHAFPATQDPDGLGEGEGKEGWRCCICGVPWNHKSTTCKTCNDDPAFLEWARDDSLGEVMLLSWAPDESVVQK